MALTIEDGTQPAGADSYVTVDEARTYADKRGLSLPVADADVEKLLIKANDYIESRRHDYQGTKATATQSLVWPRIDWKIDCQCPQDDTADPIVYIIPQELKNAQIQLAVESHAGVPLFPSPVTSATSSVGAVTEETLGPLTVKYSDKQTSESVNVADPAKGIIIATVETLLKPLMLDGCNTSYLTAIRA